MTNSKLILVVGGSAEARREKQIWIFYIFWDTTKGAQRQWFSTTPSSTGSV